MKSGLFLSAAASIMMLGSATVFAQSYTTSAAQSSQAQPVQSFHAPGYVVTPNMGIITLKPGQTYSTALPQDYGSVQAGATQVPAGGFQPLRPGEAG